MLSEVVLSLKLLKAQISFEQNDHLRPLSLPFVKAWVLELLVVRTEVRKGWVTVISFSYLQSAQSEKTKLNIGMMQTKFLNNVIKAKLGKYYCKKMLFILLKCLAAGETRP